MATKRTTRQADTDQDLIERMVCALETKSAAATLKDNRTKDTPVRPLSTQATAAIASFVKTSNELAVLPPK
ncbi:MAG: hypothetical protein LC802_24170 [Acidobacteria bacterium]|nr:hypothetical protein [Acidobacteriota bacterium]